MDSHQSAFNGRLKPGLYSPVYRQMTQARSEEILVSGVFHKPALQGGVGEVLVDGESLLELVGVGVNLGHLQAAFVSKNEDIL